MPLLSIIVPIYGVEKYLITCLDSIKNQTLTDFEAILIDDGSPDRCGEISDQYAECDSRFIVIHQENQGPSAARNTGLRAAKGKYVAFVDPDDWIVPDMFSILINRAEETNAEIICCSWVTANEAGSTKEIHELKIPSLQMNQTSFLIHLFDSPRSIGACLWNKVFMHSWISEEFNPQFFLAEDRLFLFENSKNKQFSVVCHNVPLYFYRERKDGLSRNDIKQQLIVCFVEYSILSLCRGMEKEISDHSQKDFLDTCLRVLMLFQNKNCSKEENCIGSILKQYINSNIMSICCNKAIHYKTRIMYIFWSLKNIRKYGNITKSRKDDDCFHRALQIKRDI